jgi:DNA (cytosine-5)-methyltransferase 1
MRFGSLFSGIEAASAAWLPLGWTCAWVGEIDPFACAVLKHYYPGVPNLGDVTEVDWNAVEPVDLVVGGPPCQGFSVAGNRGGLADPRGNLSLAYVRALDAVDPVWSITENVPGWLSMSDNSFGHFLGRLVGADAPLVPARGQSWTDAGVVDGPRRTAAWRVCDAQYFGVPQRRRRVFVLASRGAGNWSCASALFPFQQGVRGNPAPRREAGTQVTSSLTGSLGRRNGMPDSGEREGQLIAFDARQSDVCVYGDRAAPLDTDGHTQAVAYGADGLVDHMRRFASSVRNEAPDVFAYGGNRTSGPIDVATAVNAHGGPHGRLDFESETFITHTLRADGFDAGEDGTGRGTPLVAVAIPQNLAGEAGATASLDRRSGVMSVRRLTPRQRECARLQGFPDSYLDITYRGKPAADGNKYRALGNSMVVPVVRWLSERIARADREPAA